MTFSRHQPLRQSYADTIRELHWPLIIVVTLLGLIGVATLYSVAGGSFEPWAMRHAVRLVAGIGLMLAIAMLDVRVIHSSAYIVYGGLLALLVGVELFGDKSMGAQRWLDIGFIRLQPSEFMRLGLVLALARYFQSSHFDDISMPQYLLLPVALIAAPATLIYYQPDLGTTLMLAGVGIAILFLAGVNWRYFAAAGTLMVVSIPFVWQALRPYQQERVLVFLDPERDPLGAGYHIIQSKIGIGSGGFFGKGFNEGTQSRLNFLPEKHTDFIFTIFAEEMGFIGSLAIIVLFVLALIFIFLIARQVRSVFARLLVSGMGISLFLYVLVNMAMVMGLAPVVGVPLPFISYGGTSLLTFFIGMGLVLAMERQALIDLPRG